MDFLYILEDVRNPFFDAVFSVITHLGEETVFLAIAILFFWCINKREGYYILSVGLLGMTVNQALKLMFRIPRPWNIDRSFTVVEGAGGEAKGFSFPSGHTQNITGTFGSIAMYTVRRSVRIISIVIIVLVAFSRMYLGVHTPLDVIASLGIAFLLSYLLYPIFESEKRFEKFMPFLVVGGVILSFALLCYSLYVPFKASEAKNVADGMKNAFVLLGCSLGLAVTYALDRSVIKFDTRAPWYAQIMKLVLGLVILLLLKSGLGSLLLSLFGNEYYSSALTYFSVVLFAGCAWPSLFKYFASIKITPLDNFGKKVKAHFVKK